MTRKAFLKLCALLSVSPLIGETKDLEAYKMPALFVSHGSPMNLIRNSGYTRALANIAQSIPTPKAVLVISAHWLDDATYISISQKPKTIYDFYGFPDKLYKMKYEPKGSPLYASQVKELLQEDGLLVERGLDHGAWSVLHHIYPKQNIPTFQISMDKNLSYQEHFEIGQMLSILRDQGVLIIGSGGATHNLREVKFNSMGVDDWAYRFDRFVTESFTNKAFDQLIAAQKHPDFKIAHAFDEHFIPMLYSAGATKTTDKVEHFYEKIVMGNLSMRCIKIG